MCTSCACPQCSCCCGCKCRLCRSTVRECYEPLTKIPYRDHYVCFTCSHGWKVTSRALRVKVERVHQRNSKGGIKRQANGHPLYETKRTYLDEAPRCPRCAQEGIKVSHDFRLPKTKDKKGWKIAKALFERYGDSSTSPLTRVYCPACVKKDRMAYPSSIKEIW